MGQSVHLSRQVYHSLLHHLLQFICILLISVSIVCYTVFMDKKCIVCGKEFVVEYHQNKTKYCSDCKLLRRRERCNSFHAKKTLLEDKRCVDCGKLLRWRSGKRAKQVRCKPCSLKFSGWLAQGPGNPNWKGGRRVDKDGYIWIYHEGSHLHGRMMRASVYVPEQVLIWEQEHNRVLPKDQIIHHINKNRSDNRPENLTAMTPLQHKQLHARGNHWVRDAAIRKRHLADG